MERQTTYDDLVRFLYHEMPAGEAGQVARLLDADGEMKSAYEALFMAKMQLPKVQFNPSTAALSRIMQYSAQTAFEAHC